MTIALTSLVKLNGTVSGAIDGGTAAATLSLILQSKTITHGTGINAANLIHVDSFSIAGSGTLNYDLTGGTLLDPLGNAAIFTKVKQIILVAATTNTNNVVFGNGTNPFAGPLSAATTTITLLPGNSMELSNYSAAGWTVGTDSADIIKLTNSAAGTAVTGIIAIVGLA